MTDGDIQGAVIDYKPTKDGGGWIKIEMDEFQWDYFRSSFPSGVYYFVSFRKLHEEKT